MMIDVTVATDFAGNLAEVYGAMNPLSAGAELLWHSKTRAVFVTASNERYVITGTDLDWRGDVLVGGAIDALTYRKAGQDLVTFATLQTTGDVLWQAFEDGPVAVSGLLSRHCWTYHGSDLADVFAEGDIDRLGLADLGGNDKIYLYGGDDTFFTGAARDTVYGDMGNDQLSGGSGNDLLYGGSGDDALLGGTEDDRLWGWIGADDLAGGAGDDWASGGMGSDRIDGGAGNDTLSGGAQSDVFVFGPGSGVDVVSDYEVGQDHMQIDWSRRVTVTAQGADTEISFGQSVVLLVGVSAADISAADFI